ncbi:MAG: hypothetical protein ACK4TP_10525 [Hyphomicrobium sp.]
MVSDQPEIANARNGLAGQSRHVVGGVLAVIVGGLGLITERRHKRVQLGLGEAYDSEIKALAVERVQLGCEQLLVPASVERELVVGDDVGSALRRRKVIENDDRNSVEAELARRQQPAVARDDAALRVHQDRIGPAKLQD